MKQPAKLLSMTALTALIAGASQAEVTVLGWPGGPEETALRAAAEIYNAKSDVADADKVELLFTSRDGFFDKLQVDLAAGSTAFDANLLATYSIGKYAPFLDPISLSDEAGAVFGDTVLKTMQFEGAQYGVPRGCVETRLIVVPRSVFFVIRHLGAKPSTWLF